MSQKMLTPKTISQVTAMVAENDGDAEVKALVATVDSAQKPETKESTFNNGGTYTEQKLALRGSDGKLMYAYSKVETVDFRDLQGRIIIIAAPSFTTRSPMLKARANNKYVNLNIGKLAEVWDAGREELMNDVEDTDEREFRFDLSAIEGQSRNSGKSGTTERTGEATARKSNVSNIGGSTLVSIVSLSQIAEKYSEAIGYAQQIAAEVGITDEQAIQAMAATIFIGYTNQRDNRLGSASIAELMAPEEEEVEETVEEEEVEEAPKTRKRRAPVIEEETEDDEEEEEEEEEDESPAPVRRRAAKKSSPAVSKTISGKSKPASGSERNISPSKSGTNNKKSRK